MANLCRDSRGWIGKDVVKSCGKYQEILRLDVLNKRNSEACGDIVGAQRLKNNSMGKLWSIYLVTCPRVSLELFDWVQRTAEMYWNACTLQNQVSIDLMGNLFLYRMMVVGTRRSEVSDARTRRRRTVKSGRDEIHRAFVQLDTNTTHCFNNSGLVFRVNLLLSDFKEMCALFKTLLCICF